MKAFILSCLSLFSAHVVIAQQPISTTKDTVNTKNLKEVVIQGSKPIIKQETDRITYDLQADPESKGNNVLDMMRKVPFISMDVDNNVLLKGESNYKIFINGKPSSMMERSYKEILRSMPASTIQKIEVITSPGSKYDSEGIGGIINIITNKKIDNGYNGTLNANERFPVGGPGLGGTFNFKQGKFGAVLLGGGSFSKTPTTIGSSFRETTGISSTNLMQNRSSRSDSKNGYLGFETSYELDSLNLISAQFNINGSRSNNRNNQNSLLSNSGTVSEKYDLSGIGLGIGNGLDVAINYQLGFKSSKNRLLTFSYRYMEFGNDQRSNLNVINRFNYDLTDYNQLNDGGSSEQTFQVDYVQPIKMITMEAGVKGILRTNKSDFQYLSFNSATGDFDLDNNRSNKYLNSQDVFGLYNSYEINLKNWGFKAGVRIEQTIIDANFISSVALVEQNYFSILPAVNVVRKFKNMGSISLNYTIRLQRPGINQLDPFVNRTNPTFETTGNPDLKPSYSNNFQLSYNKSKKTTLNLSLSYRFVNTLVGPVVTIDRATGISRTTTTNTGSGNLFVSNLYYTYPVTKKLNLVLNGDMRYIYVNVPANGQNSIVKGFIESFTLSGSYRFDNGLRLNGNFSHSGPNISGPQALTKGFVNTSLSANKEIVKSKLTLSASVTNPFSKFRRNNENISGPDFDQTNINQIYYRSFSTSLNYNFGKLKTTIKKNKRSIKNDDISN